MIYNCFDGPCCRVTVQSYFQGHMSQCKFKPVPCAQCGKLIETQAIDEHMNKDCPKRRIACKHCNSEVIVEDLEVPDHDQCKSAVRLISLNFM